MDVNAINGGTKMNNLPPTISDALYALGIDGGWKIKESKIVKWYSEESQPSDSAIDTKLKELQAEYDTNQYQRDRAVSYPSWQEQMDLIYHSGVAGLKAELKKTKDKYPKG